MKPEEEYRELSNKVQDLMTQAISDDSFLLEDFLLFRNQAFDVSYYILSMLRCTIEHKIKRVPFYLSTMSSIWRETYEQIVVSSYHGNYWFYNKDGSYIKDYKIISNETGSLDFPLKTNPSNDMEYIYELMYGTETNRNLCINIDTNNTMYKEQCTVLTVKLYNLLFHE